MSNFDFDIEQQKKHYQAMDDNATVLIEIIDGIKDHAMLFKALLSGTVLTNKHGHLLSLENGVLTLAVGSRKTTDIKRIEPLKWRVPNEKDLIMAETRNALKKLSQHEFELIKNHFDSFSAEVSGKSLLNAYNSKCDAILKTKDPHITSNIEQMIAVFKKTTYKTPDTVYLGHEEMMQLKSEVVATGSSQVSDSSFIFGIKINELPVQKALFII